MHPLGAIELAERLVKVFNKFYFRHEEQAGSHSLLLEEKGRLEKEFC